MTTDARPTRLRARPMSPDERRESLVEATLELLRVHGREVTTRQIAHAANVAEGTIFRVFESKDELVDAAIGRAFRPGGLLTELDAVDDGLEFRPRLVAVVALMQRRFRATFDLMGKVDIIRPPAHVHGVEEVARVRAAVAERLVRLVGRDAASLSVPAADFVHTLRMLTFAGSHPHVSEGRPLTPEQIVDTVLHGLLRPDLGPRPDLRSDPAREGTR